MRRAAVVPVILALACAGKDTADTAPAAPVTPPDTAPPVPTDTAPDPPADADSDGHAADVDCDDYDPAVFPGATETWNAVDDDCDGRVDGDGAYAGAATLAATAIYEGQTYLFTVPCDAALTRYGEASLELDVLCATDPTDDDAQLLLGPEVAMTVVDNAALKGPVWAGAVRFSSDGWAADGAGELQWADFESAALTASMSSTYLTISMSGALTWTP